MGQNKSIIIGSGISGLLRAYYLASKKKTDVVIIEKNQEVGGLLRKFDYGDEYGVFDHGMHNIMETGIPQLDEFIFSLLDKEDWQILEGENRDLAGIYFSNTLQKNTPYFDLRNLEKHEYEKCLFEFFSNLDEKSSQGNFSTDFSAADYAKHRFGDYIASKTIIPSVEKIFQKPAHDLDYMATILTPMTRVALYDSPLLDDLIKSDVLRSKLAYSPQKDLPLKLSSGRKAYYPKKYGMYRVIDALVSKLKELNVEIKLSTELKEINFENNCVNSISILSHGQLIELDNIQDFIWTGNIPFLGRMLGVDFTGLKHDKTLKTIVVSLLLDKPLDMDGLYYFFCYQKGFHTYRLNDFNAYCSGAKRKGLYPISMELLMSEDQINKSKLSFEEIAIDELNKFGILQFETKIVFAKAEPLESGLPMPSKNNINAIKNIRKQIIGMNFSNLEIIGILAEDNLFFQTDVLRDVFQKSIRE